MEVNKGEAERCRDMGAVAMRQGQFNRAAKLFRKSLSLFPLPGVEALLNQAEGMAKKEKEGTNSSNSTTSNGTSSSAPRRETSTSSSSTTTTTRQTSSGTSNNNGSDGRAYTSEQVNIVKKILGAKEGGRGAHYRVLGIQQTATENDIKKAYRKISLKVHPDKNPAPQSDEAFKAVGLAYATLSDTQKRAIYDRYGDEDPDNVGGSSRGGGVRFRRGQEVDPDEIFNMFFGGGMNGMHMRGAPGFHVYTNGFGGPGMQFRRAGGGQGNQQQERPGGFAVLLQFLPFLIIMLLSFFNFQDDSTSTSFMQNRYFSLTHTPPYINAQYTRFTKVKDIPYYVTDRFMKTYYRDRYHLAQVEHLVEKSYKQYLAHECNQQKIYQNDLIRQAKKQTGIEARQRALEKAQDFELTRCDELEDLFPSKKKKYSYYSR